eukprot:2487553-Rhodomonas_salina.1
MGHPGTCLEVPGYLFGPFGPFGGLVARLDSSRTAADCAGRVRGTRGRATDTPGTVTTYKGRTMSIIAVIKQKHFPAITVPGYLGVP